MNTREMSKKNFYHLITLTLPLIVSFSLKLSVSVLLSFGSSKVIGLSLISCRLVFQAYVKD